jgi:hypothetical protein
MMLLLHFLPIRVVDVRLVMGCVLASFAFVETICYAALKVSGPQTWTYPTAFRNLNYLNVPPSVMRPPTERRLAKFAETLEVERYRSVLLNEKVRYRVSETPHISEFWRLRLIGGYGTGIPKRLADLPWSERAQWLREIELTSLSDVDFHVLALLNVKYILLPTQDLYFNIASGELDNIKRQIRTVEGTNYSAEPVTIDGVALGILCNPVEALPRHFFVKDVTGVALAPQFRFDRTSESDNDNSIISDIGHLRDHSLAEQFSGTRSFDANGELKVTYQGDTIDIEVSPSDQNRFVVLNERFHPAWHGRSNTAEIAVLPTNAVMMGIQVPPGIDHVQLHFEPISGRTHVLTVVALVALVSVAAGLRLIEVRASKADENQFQGKETHK